jgi:hypothetical protein
MLDASDGSEEGNSEPRELGDLLGSSVRVIGSFVGALTGASLEDLLGESLGATL